MNVADSALTALGNDDFLSVLKDVTEHDLGLAIPNFSSERNLQDAIGSIGAVHLPAAAISAMACTLVRTEEKPDQRVLVFISTKKDTAALAAITTIGAAVGHELLSPEASGAVAALARCCVDDDMINEFA